jgi:hypothetical protein
VPCSECAGMFIEYPQDYPSLGSWWLCGFQLSPDLAGPCAATAGSGRGCGLWPGKCFFLEQVKRLHDLHSLFSTSLHLEPFRLAEWRLASPFLKPSKPLPLSISGPSDGAAFFWRGTKNKNEPQVVSWFRRMRARSLARLVNARDFGMMPSGEGENPTSKQPFSFPQHPHTLESTCALLLR